MAFFPVRCFKIDAFAHTITEAEFSGDYKDIYRIGQFDMMEAVHLENDDVIYVDEEGLLKPCTNFFTVRGFHQPLAGNGVVLGTDGEGDSIEPKITLTELRARVTFFTKIGKALYLVPTP